HPAIVQRHHRVVEAGQLLPEPTLASRSRLPGTRRLRIVREGKNQPTKTRMRLTYACLSTSVPALEFGLSGAARQPRVERGRLRFGSVFSDWLGDGLGAPRGRLTRRCRGGPGAG